MSYKNLSINKENLLAFIAFLLLFCNHYWQFILYKGLGLSGGVSFIQLALSVIIIINLKLSKEFFRTPFVFLLFVFFLYAYINGVFLVKGDNQYALSKVNGVLYLVFANFIYVIVSLRSNKSIVQVLQFFKFSLIFLLFISYVFPGYHGLRLTTIGLNPIWFARLLGYLFIFLTFDFFYHRRNIYLIPLLLLISNKLISSGSAGPIVSLSLSLTYVVIITIRYNYKSIVRRYMRALIPLFVLFTILFAIYLWQNIDFFKFPSFAYRKTMFSYLFNLNNASFFGLGFGNFYELGGLAQRFSYPHNIIIETFLELGLPGIIFFATAVSFFIYATPIKYFYIKLSYKDDRLLLLHTFVVFSFVNAMFSGDLLIGNIFLYIFALFYTYYFHGLKKC